MRADHVDRLQAWFDSFSRSFLKGTAEVDTPLLLKIEHTQRVMGNIVRLAHAIGMNAQAVRVAEVIALFHDIGRFDQYHRYGTFNDRQSANHARLGVTVMKKNGVLSPLADDQQAIILDAIQLHNAPTLPPDRSPESLIFLRLIRDADKLDIWRIFAETFTNRRGSHPTVIQNLPDAPTWSAAILAAIDEKRMARLKNMKSLIDFKLLQLSWVFDLQFDETCRQALMRGNVMEIARTLPEDGALRRTICLVTEELTRRATTTAR